MPTTVRIAVLDDYQRVAPQMADWSPLAGHEIAVFDRPFRSLDETAVALEPFEIVCCMRERTPFPAALLARLPALRLLVTTGMWNAAIDVEAATAQGITVCGTGGSGTSTAELTWGLIHAAIRHIPIEDANVREGRWQTTVGTDLAGKTLGVLGLGRIGTAVARVGAAFDMRIVAWSPNLTAERAAEVGAMFVERDTLFATADVLTIHLVLAPTTRGLVGAGELAAMKPDAVLVNTSRGPIVDEVALLDALDRGTIAGAGLDVFETEPLPADHPLRRAPRTVLTPHVGYVTRENYRLFYGETVEAVAAYLAGSPVRVIAAP
jgi:phosphoglycerate dehydrogenase-like enzyme